MLTSQALENEIGLEILLVRNAGLTVELLSYSSEQFKASVIFRLKAAVQTKCTTNVKVKLQMR
jgi:hypothetical protein